MFLSIAVCIYNDFDFLAESIERVYEFADEIVILDGPYDYCIPMLKFLDMHYEEPPEPLKSIRRRPKVRYEYRVFSDERAKRIRLYEMCRGDVVMLLDSDELVTSIDRQALADFAVSDKAVAGARFHNHVRANVLSSEDTRKLIFFKRDRIGAEQHLDYTWLVGVKQNKPDRNIIFDHKRPVVDIAHLTLMRSPYFSTVKYCFYTRLYQSTNNLTSETNKLFGRTFEELSASSAAMEIYRDLFRRSMTDPLNFPEREKLHAAPSAVALPTRYDAIAAIEPLDDAKTCAVLHGVNTHHYVAVPKHLKAGDPLSFFFTASNVASMNVEAVFHDGERCERVEAKVTRGRDGEYHGVIELPFDAGGWFGVLFAFRPRCADPRALGEISGFRFKKRLGFYGNCQTENLVPFLQSSPSFNREFDVDPTPGRLVHMMNDEEIAQFHTQLHRLDYLILQPISDAFRGAAFGSAAILAGLRPEARVFMMPNLFVTAYAPESYCVTYRKKFMQRPMPIHDVNFIYSYLKHQGERTRTKADYLAKLHDPEFYSASFVRAAMEKNIDELAARERECAGKFARENTRFYSYAEFVAHEHDKVLLHYSDSHPTEYVFQRIASEILADLRLPDEQQPVALKERGVLPYYRAIGDTLGFDAAKEPIYMNRPVAFDDYFSDYCKVYDEHDRNELFGYISQRVVKLIVTNHKTGTMLMHGVLHEYCTKYRLKLLDLNQHLSANADRIDGSVDFQSYDFIFVTHAQHFERLLNAAPRLRYRAIHLVRHPLEIIMSGVRYHQITDEGWCNLKLFVSDAAEPSGYRRIAAYNAPKEQAGGELTYREIMNHLGERERIAFEIRQHAGAFGTIPSIVSFLRRFRDDGNVATLRLEDISAPECVAFVFRFLALNEDFLPAYRAKVGERGWLGKHVTNREGKSTYGAAFDADLHALFASELGANTLAQCGYAEDSPLPIYFREPVAPLDAAREEVDPAVSVVGPEGADSNATFAIGEKLMASGQLELARQAFEKALSRNHSGIGVLGRLGDLNVRLGRPAESLTYYRRIEEIVETPPSWLYVGIANALEALGERVSAYSNLQRAIELGHDTPETQARLKRLAS